MVLTEREDGYWLADEDRLDVAGPFESEQKAVDYYLRMDYQYE